MRTFRFILAAVAMALLAAVGRSEAAEPAIQIFGAGIRSCGVWLQHTVNTDPLHIEMGSWVDGYLSGRNEAIAATGKAGMLGSTVDNDGRDAWITKYCQARPLNLLYAAAKALADELEKTGR